VTRFKKCIILRDCIHSDEVGLLIQPMSKLRASLVPAAAVIPAHRVYVIAIAVKTFVVILFFTVRKLVFVFSLRVSMG